MIDENSMKKPNTPNMGNRIIDFSKRKPMIPAGIASVAILLIHTLRPSIDDFLGSDDDESKRSLIEEVDYTGYRDTSTSVRTPSDYRRGGDNEESITKRIESAPNDRQTTTDESMKEIEEILTAEGVLYTVKEGDTRSNILMENVWLSSLKNEDFAKKAVFSTLAKNPQIKLIKQVKKGTSTASFPNLQSKLNPGDIIKIRMPATRDSIREIVETSKLLLWDPVAEKDIEKFNYTGKINSTDVASFFIMKILGAKGIQYRPKSGMDEITDITLPYYEPIIREYLAIKIGKKWYRFPKDIDLHDKKMVWLFFQKDADFRLDRDWLKKYLKTSKAQKAFHYDPIRYAITRKLTQQQANLKTYNSKGHRIPDVEYLVKQSPGNTLCGRVSREQLRNTFKINVSLSYLGDASAVIKWIPESNHCYKGNLSGKPLSKDAIKFKNQGYNQQDKKSKQEHGPRIKAYRGILDGRTTYDNAKWWNGELKYEDFLKAAQKLKDLGYEADVIQLCSNHGKHISTGGYLGASSGWIVRDSYAKKNHNNIPLKEYFEIYKAKGGPILKVIFFKGNETLVIK